MQIITGKYRGRRLKSPESARPTLQRVKTSLFSMLNPYIFDGCKVLDLFAGSGALGFETLSRGAAKTIFVDQDRGAVRTIKENLKGVDPKLYSIMEMDYLSALKSLRGEKFDIIFMDPPYNKELEKEVLQFLSTSSLLKPDTKIIVEASTETSFDYVEEMGFEITKYKKYKTNVHVFLRKK